MMLKEIKFGKVKNILNKLGFEDTRVKGSHVRFRNPYADAIIILSDQKIIKLHQIRMIEKVLEEKGILNREDFENFFQ
jgi:predicted RNA binding protein YcfA (HicA-like mRNA interferase family)